jgi:rhodanese-related sulfurtransferase
MNDQERTEMLRFSKSRMFVCNMTYAGCICLLLLALMYTSTLHAAEEQSTKKVKQSTGPYCGLNCAYFILRLSGQQINFADILKPEYISSWEGSSLSELKKVIEDNGLVAEHINRLTTPILKELRIPIILHVKKEYSDKEYNHYVLFLGNKNDNAIIYDPPNPIETIPYFELAPRWNGTGLIVSADPINLGKILAPARKQFTFFAGAIIIAIVLVKIASIYLSGKVKNISIPAMLTFSVAQSAGLVMVALLIGVVYHFANDEGFLAHAGAVEPVVKASTGSFIPKVAAKDIEKIKDSSVIIDARQTADYDAGHIDGAINIPTMLDAAGRNAKLGNTPKDSRVIIYCQSAGCPYAEKVASNLMEDGFANIVIYKGGWVDWQKYIGAKNENK